LVPLLLVFATVLVIVLAMFVTPGAVNLHILNNHNIPG
jgi:hypothetical protein